MLRVALSIVCINSLLVNINCNFSTTSSIHKLNSFRSILHSINSVIARVFTSKKVEGVSCLYEKKLKCRWSDYCRSAFLWFERNWGNDHRDMTLNPTCVIITRKNLHILLVEVTKNWSSYHRVLAVVERKLSKSQRGVK